MPHNTPSPIHQGALCSAAWSKRVQRADGRRVLLFSRLARPLAALVVTASDAQLLAAWDAVTNETTAPI